MIQGVTPTLDVIVLRAAGAALVLDCRGEDLPRVLHWGADIGSAGEDELVRLAQDLVPATGHSALDEPWPFTLLPGSADGWSGRPGVALARDGRPVFPRWRLTRPVALDHDPDGAQRLTVDAAAHGVGAEGVTLRTEVRCEPSGLLRLRHTITQAQGADSGPLEVAGLGCVLPLPGTATEVLDLSGRWCRERLPQRGAVRFGSWLREARRGRTGHDASLLMACGTTGFGFRQGEVWATHVAWSGDHVAYVERLPEGAGWHGGPVIGGGELLAPGEVRLAPGESYTTPWLLATYSDQGLDGATARIHRWLRARPHHPDPVRRPRPLVLNTWEAVYFGHDLDRLTELAERAASIGVERFVLDDGWFGGRRHDRAGLGDWQVSPEMWPGGLRPLADRVRALGMDFGLWFEPEMLNVDSDVVRAHPDWLLGGEQRDWRHQQVLDLTAPGAWDYLLGAISALVEEIGIAFIKWDHNRDLHGTGAHAQTLALYGLLDALRVRHPGLEIESCASGGARVDLGILERTDRVWASDTNDPLERQLIQRWTASLLPPELVGSHVGGPVSHTTARTASLGLRCVTALFQHAGIEWDITGCSDAELRDLASWTALYRELRQLLHTGDVVRLDAPDGTDATEAGPALLTHGVVAPDRAEAVFAHVRLRTSGAANPGRIRLAGLDPARSYRLRRRDEAGTPSGPAISQPPWWERGELVASGAVLMEVGVPAPLLHPGEAALVHLTPA